MLLTGGHVEGDPTDALATAEGVDLLSDPRIGGEMHGTGCTLAMALACELARERRSRRGSRGARVRSQRNRQALTRPP